MAGLRFLTAGESHGPGLTVIVEGLPLGLAIGAEAIDRELARRQRGYGRGARMGIESDRVEIRGGVRHGYSIGGPIALWIENHDFANWRESMSPLPAPGAELRAVQRPRPGHADLAGCLKLGIDDARVVLERSSARETAARVAAGALAKALLREIGVEVLSHTTSIGPIEVALPGAVAWEAIAAIPESAPFRTANPAAESRLIAEVDAARRSGDTLGGRFEVVAHTPPAGLGHFVQWDLRLDGRLAQALLSIPAAKSLSIGSLGAAHELRGSATHDPIREEKGRLLRPSNRAGGLEGGMTNGEELRLCVGMKPLSTLRQPLESIDLRTGNRADAAFERSDVSVVPAAGVVGEAMVALVLASATLEKFGGDSLRETLRNFEAYRDGLGRRSQEA